MAADNRATILTKAKTTIEAVTDAGAVFKSVPAWRSAEEMEARAQVVLSSGDKEFRFWTIVDRVMRSPWTFAGANSTDLVSHFLTISGWVAAKLDYVPPGEKVPDGGATTKGVTDALLAAVLAAFADPSVLSTGNNYCNYADDGLPEEIGEVEYRQLHGNVFHVATLGVVPREEVARA